MYHNFLLNFIQRFSYLQQYLIILSLSLILLIIFNYWWLIFLLPLSTILANFFIKRLSNHQKNPLKISGYIYKLFFRKRLNNKIDKSIEIYDESIINECNKYTRTIIARYICVWYYPLISTNQEFPDDLKVIFNIILNRLIDRLKSLNIHDFIRHIINLKQKHLEEYLYTYDSYRKQRKQNRINQTIIEEYSQLIGFHYGVNKNDIYAYLKAIVELLITDLLPETFTIYSYSRPGREFLTQILVNCVFLPLFNEFSKPQMIYTLLITLLETDEQKQNIELNENLLEKELKSDEDSNLKKSVKHTGIFEQQINNDNKHRISRLERIIYSATIISTDTAYNSMSGAAYTVYIIQCETKSPFISNEIHRYTIRRRFREFINLHERLQKNLVTSRHCYDIDEIFRHLPNALDNMNPDIIRRRRIKLEEYIQRLISNEVLNCSHDVLEFFAFNSDPNKQFESLQPSTLPVPRVDKVLLRTLSGVGTKISSLFPTTNKVEVLPIRETFQLNVSITYETSSTLKKQLEQFIQRSALEPSFSSIKLNLIDSEFLKILITRPSIVTSNRKEKTQSNIPLTDAILDLIYTCLHSRDALISNESIYQILRTIFGHFLEELLKHQIDGAISPEKILDYLTTLRTKVLWPENNNNNNTSIPMKNVKQRAYNALINVIPMWLQYLVGVENIRQIVSNLIQCLSYEELNRHFLCNTFDLLIERLIPNISSKDFLTKYVHMHNGIRT